MPATKQLTFAEEGRSSSSPFECVEQVKTKGEDSWRFGGSPLLKFGGSPVRRFAGSQLRS